MPLNELFPQSIDVERKASSVIVSDDPHFSYMKMIKVRLSYLDESIILSRQPIIFLIQTVDSSSLMRMQISTREVMLFLVSDIHLQFIVIMEKYE